MSEHRYTAQEMREAAARLRKSTLIEAALNINVGMNNAAATITADLLRRLKIAEDALSDSVPHLCARCAIWNGGPNCGHNINHVDCAGGKVRRALAAIREKGGTK